MFEMNDSVYGNILENVTNVPIIFLIRPSNVNFSLNKPGTAQVGAISKAQK